MFGKFALMGNRVAALQLGTRVFLEGNQIDRRQFFKRILCSIKASLNKRFLLVLNV